MENLDYIEIINGVAVWHRGGGYDIEVDLGDGANPPKTEQQATQAASTTEQSVDGPDDVEQRHRKWVESEGWKTVSSNAIAAVDQKPVVQ